MQPIGRVTRFTKIVCKRLDVTMHPSVFDTFIYSVADIVVQVVQEKQKPLVGVKNMDARTIYETICYEQMRAEDRNEPTHFIMKSDAGMIAQGFIYPNVVSINLVVGVYVRLEFTRMELGEGADANRYIYMFKPTVDSHGYIGMIATDEIVAFEVD